MAIVRLTSAKLPILIALPALIVMGVVAVFLLQPDPPPPPKPAPLDDLPGSEPHHRPPDADPLKPDPNARPRPEPRPGAPSTAELASDMSSEAWDGLESIRSRLELKFKYAEYTLDRTWTLETVMRKLERLDGKHFAGTDYSLTYPEGTEPMAEIVCATIQGQELPDGPLKLSVNIRTGESEKTGHILARDVNGFVLLGLASYQQITECLTTAVVSHALAQRETEPGTLASLDNRIETWQAPDFAPADFSAVQVQPKPLCVEFACRSFHGEELAEPAVIQIDYATQSVQISRVSAATWLPLPSDREQYKDRCRWALRSLAYQAVNRLASGTAPTEISQQSLNMENWAVRYSGVLPFEFAIEITESDPRKAIVSIATHFGRPLPFKRLRYVAQVGSETADYAD